MICVLILYHVASVEDKFYTVMQVLHFDSAEFAL